VGRLICANHGWADNLLAPLNSIDISTALFPNLGGLEKAEASVRLFMAPGMGHCAGGEGPNTFDMVARLEAWVEQGKAPDLCDCLK